MSIDDEVRIFNQIKALIKEFNERDQPAIARGKEERNKWFQAQKEFGEQDDPQS